MKILFITSTRLGDGVISTGALNHFIKEYPNSEITIACGPLVAGIFEEFPNIKNIISLKKEPYSKHWLKLWLEVYKIKWDIIIDLRNSIISRLLFANKKYIWGNSNKEKHKVEQIAELIKASPPPSPYLWFKNKTLKEAKSIAPKGSPILAIGPAANWPGKTWPTENFIELIERLTAKDSIFPEARVAIIAAPNEEETAYKVLNSVPFYRQIDVIGKSSPVISAAVIKQCDIYIGNDSGLMHCAMAVGTPTLGLFGPSWPQLYRPWGEHCAYVSTPENYDELTNFEGYSPDNIFESLMKSLTVDMVYNATLDLYKQQS